MLNYEFPPVGGGAANANRRFLEELARRDEFAVDLVTSSASNRFECEPFADGIRVFRLDVGKRDVHHWRTSEIARWTWGAYWCSRRLLGENRYDLCHCWSGWPAGVIGYLHRKKLPYIVALRGSDVPGANPRLGTLDKSLIPFISRRVWSAARAVTALSRYSANMARHTLDCGIQVIYNGFDTERFSPAPDFDEIASRAVRLLTVSRLSVNKGTEHVIRATRLLVDRYPDRDVRLTVVGSGFLGDELKTLTGELGLGEHVRFLGVRPHEALPEIYRAHDIFILASLHEALGNVIQEAIACGLAVITTETGSAELIDGNGLIVRKRDAADIAAKVAGLIDDEERLAAFKRRSVELARTRSWARCCDEYVDLYRRALARSAPVGGAGPADEPEP